MTKEAVNEESEVEDLEGGSESEPSEVEEESAEEEMNAESEEESNQEEEALDSRFSDAQIQGLVEALVFTNGEPIGLGKLKRITGLPENRLQDILESIQMKFEIEDSGFRLVNAGGKFQFRTEQIYSDFIKRLKEEKPRKLSPAALETLAIVAYRQPIVKSDIEKIRGVDATPTIKTLIDRRLIRIVGHQATVGQPALYGTSEGFLKIFGLKSLSELPTLRDLKELEADPGEVEEMSGADEIDLSDEQLEDDNEDISEEGAEEEANEESESFNIVELPTDSQEESTDERPLVGNE